MSAEQIARVEDTRAGRTIPAWRYELGWWLIAVSLLAIHMVPDGLLWRTVVAFICLFAYALLIRPYRMRSIN